MVAPNVGIEFPSITRVERPTYPVAAALVPSLLPTAAVPLRMGEWLTAAGGSLARVAAGAQAVVPTYMWWEWLGVTGVQALDAGAILLPPYRGWSLVYDAAGIPFAYGGQLSVIGIGAGLWTGHSGLQTTVAGFVVARVLDPLPAAATDRLYFHTAY